MADVWSFNVGLSSHDLLKRGITVHVWTRVVVTGSDDVDAHLTAAQLAHAANPGMMVTEVEMDEFPMSG